jgi:hypothetical protein
VIHEEFREQEIAGMIFADFTHYQTTGDLPKWIPIRWLIDLYLEGYDEVPYWCEPLPECCFCERPADAGGFLWPMCSNCAATHEKEREKDFGIMANGIDRIRNSDSL